MADTNRDGSKRSPISVIFMQFLAKFLRSIWFSYRVTTAQGKQGIWFLLFPDRENTGNFALTQGKILRHREKFRHRENI